MPSRKSPWIRLLPAEAGLGCSQLVTQLRERGGQGAAGPGDQEREPVELPVQEPLGQAHVSQPAVAPVDVVQGREDIHHRAGQGLALGRSVDGRGQDLGRDHSVEVFHDVTGHVHHRAGRGHGQHAGDGDAGPGQSAQDASLAQHVVTAPGDGRRGRAAKHHRPFGVMDRVGQVGVAVADRGQPHRRLAQPLRLQPGRQVGEVEGEPGGVHGTWAPW